MHCLECSNWIKLEGMAHYARQILALAEGFGQNFFGPFGQKEAYYAVLVILEYFWCSVVPLVAFNSYPNNFEKKKKKRLFS